MSITQMGNHNGPWQTITTNGTGVMYTNGQIVYSAPVTTAPPKTGFKSFPELEMERLEFLKADVLKQEVQYRYGTALWWGFWKYVFGKSRVYHYLEVHSEIGDPEQVQEIVESICNGDWRVAKRTVYKGRLYFDLTPERD